MRIEASTIIDRDSATVFDFTAANHLENHTRWDPSVSGITPLTPGEFGLGSRFRLDRRTAGRQEARDFEVTEWQRPSRFTITTASPGFRLALIERLEPTVARGTRLTLVGEAQIGGIRGLLAPLLKGRFQRELDANLELIKTMVESA